MIHLLNLGRSYGLSQILAGTDIFHISNHLQHAPRGMRLTSTLYDLTWMSMPQFHTAENVFVSASAVCRTRYLPERTDLSPDFRKHSKRCDPVFS